ncbi:hypothetical protein [Poseidonibacter ostreae]|uniref:Uncharacterized protein n=1 Tax=Poseidonibacter ostreae TaxID=2654171 RepID=A0A6L4WX67_9BACT|nr:hypothetical protein [Poseidonibacter ostreae]KAB7891343.1 hypothetical protein GBG19_00470 [Poseidonibacter ostreae]
MAIIDFIRKEEPYIRGKKEVFLLSVARKPFFINALLVNAVILNRFDFNVPSSDLSKEQKKELTYYMRDVILKDVDKESITTQRIEDEIIMFFQPKEIRRALKSVIP